MAAHVVARPIWATSLVGERSGFAVARALLRKWAASRHGGWPAGQDPLRARWFPAPGCRVVSDTWVADGCQVWSITVDRPADGMPGLCWRTVATLTDAADGRLLVQVAHGFEPVESRVVAPPVFEPVRPSFIPALLNAVVLADAGVRLAPRAVSPVGLEAFVADRARRFPVLVAGAGVDVGKLADFAAGAAVVVDGGLLDGGGWVAAGGRLAGDGLVAVHWADGRVDVVGPVRGVCVERVAGRRVFVGSQFAVVEDPLSGRVRSASLKARWQPAAVAVSAPAAGVVADAVGSGEMLEAWEADLGRLDAVEAELGVARAELTVLQARLSAFEGASRGRDVTVSAGVDVSSPVAAVRSAQALFAGLFDFHPRVWAGLHRFEYLEASHLFLDLVRLSGMVARWQAGEGPLDRLASDAGLPGWSPQVSPSALQQFGSDYTIRWEGCDVVCGAHFGRGSRSAANCYRTYVWLDEVRRRAVIGWVGRHLRDSSNPR